MEILIGIGAAVVGTVLGFVGKTAIGWAGKGALMETINDIEKRRAEGEAKTWKKIDEMDDVFSVNYNALDKQIAVLTDRQQNTAKVLDEIWKKMHELRGEMRSNTENIITAIIKSKEQP